MNKINEILTKKFIKDQFKKSYSMDISEPKVDFYKQIENEREQAANERLKIEKIAKQQIEKNELKHKEEIKLLIDHIKSLEKKVNQLTIQNDILAGKAHKEERENDNVMSKLEAGIQSLADEIFEK